MERYHLGVTTMQPPMFAEGNHTLLWRIDERQRPRCAKIMRFNSYTGHRLKSGTNEKPDWLHAHLYNTEYCPYGWKDNFRQCFFGQHLITEGCDIALTEGENTAIIASVFFPDSVWISCGGLSNLKKVLENEWQVLRGHKVMVYPDAGCMEKWKEYFIPYENDLDVAFSMYLENHCSDADRANGIDIADRLISMQQTRIKASQEPKSHRRNNPTAQAETKQSDAVLYLAGESGQRPYYHRFKSYPPYVTMQDIIFNERYNTLIDYKDPPQVFAKLDWMHNYPAWTQEEWINHYRHMVRTEDIPNAETDFYKCIDLFEYADKDKGLIKFVG